MYGYGLAGLHLLLETDIALVRKGDKGKRSLDLFPDLLHHPGILEHAVHVKRPPAALVLPGKERVESRGHEQNAARLP